MHTCLAAVSAVERPECSAVNSFEVSYNTMISKDFIVWPRIHHCKALPEISGRLGPSRCFIHRLIHRFCEQAVFAFSTSRLAVIGNEAPHQCLPSACPSRPVRKPAPPSLLRAGTHAIMRALRNGHAILA